MMHNKRHAGASMLFSRLLHQLNKRQLLTKQQSPVIPAEAWLNTVADIENVRFCPVDNEIAIKSTTLPGEFHKDPADRMIVALVKKLGCRLITADEKIRNYPHVHTVWNSD